MRFLLCRPYLMPCNLSWRLVRLMFLDRRQEKDVGNLVDTSAAESLEITKRQSRDKETVDAEEARVYEARNRGIRNCRPGSHATQFLVPRGA